MIYEGIEFYNIQEIREEKEGLVLSRVPESVRKKLNPHARTNAWSPAGSEMRFCLEGELEVELLVEGTWEGVVEVFQGDFFYDRKIVGEKATRISVQPFGDWKKLRDYKISRRFSPRITRILFPHQGMVRIKDIRIRGKVKPPSPENVPSVKYLTYGSSITQGILSLHPSGTYAMITAENLGVDLINLGFGGGAHCEKEIADYIGGRDDWDFASLEVGINMLVDFSPEEFERRVRYLVEKISSLHRDKPIFVIDIFTCRWDVEGWEKVNVFREIVREICKEKSGRNVYHLEGRELLPDFSGICVDLVHPDEQGMRVIAKNLTQRIRELLT